jgi:hypothetical protein
VIPEQHPDAHLYDAAEPIRGLPARLPPGERILWQGAPNWRHMARYSFHIRKVAAYFGVLLLWDVISATYDGALAEVAGSILELIGLSCVVLAIIAIFCWAVERTTVYTVTSRRVVIRAGIALPKTVNIPYVRVDSVDLRLRGEGHGDILLTPLATDHLAYLVLWPHVQAFQFRHGRPLLRSVKDAPAVARIIGQAVGAVVTAPPAAAPVMAGAPA